MAIAYFIEDNDYIESLAGVPVGETVTDFITNNPGWYRHLENASALCNNSFAGGTMVFVVFGETEEREQEGTSFTPPTVPTPPL